MTWLALNLVKFKRPLSRKSFHGVSCKGHFPIVLLLINWDVLYKHPNAMRGSIRFSGSPQQQNCEFSLTRRKGFKSIVVGSRRHSVDFNSSFTPLFAVNISGDAQTFQESLGPTQTSNYHISFTKNSLFWIKAQRLICFNHKLYSSQFMEYRWLYWYNYSPFINILHII